MTYLEELPVIRQMLRIKSHPVNLKPKLNASTAVCDRTQKALHYQSIMPIEVHTVRIGDLVFSTNPFEVYLDYAVRICELFNEERTS